MYTSTDYETIQKQHDLLKSLLIDCKHSVERKTSLVFNKRMLREFRGVLLYHFACEEQYLQKNQTMQGHMDEHVLFLLQFTELIENANNRKDIKRAIGFYETWIVHHIEHFDKPFLRQI